MVLLHCITFSHTDCLLEKYRQNERKHYFNSFILQITSNVLNQRDKTGRNDKTDKD